MLATLLSSPTKRRRRFPARSRLVGENLEERVVLSAVPPTVVDVEVASSDWSSAFYDYLRDENLGDNGYSIPTGSTAQLDSLPWNNIDTLRIEFSENVWVDEADLSLTSTLDAAFEVIDFDFYSDTNVAEWVFANPLPNDRYLIDLDADGGDAVRDFHGNRLDGEWSDGVTAGASGDGVAGGDFEFSLNLLAGDALNLGLLDYNNLWAVYLSVGQDTNHISYDPRKDVDGSGVIDTPDWEQIWGDMWATLPTGDPVGEGDDAPSTIGFDRVAISDYTSDVSVQLDPRFSDQGAGALTYSIVEISDATLFDQIYIDQANGELVMNAAEPLPPPGGYAALSGGDRASVKIAATDSSGQQVTSTVTVDIMRDNLSPMLIAVTATVGAGNTWIVEGYVQDPDDNVDLFNVLYASNGSHTGIASVADDGYFSFSAQVDPGDILQFNMFVADDLGGWDIHSVLVGF